MLLFYLLFSTIAVSQGFQLLTSRIKLMNQLSITATIDKSLNFNDEAVECLSEGGDWKMPARLLTEQENLQFELIQIQNNQTMLTLVSRKSDLILDLLKTQANAIDIVKLCDLLDEKSIDEIDKLLIKIRRKVLLSKILSKDSLKYKEIVLFLSNRMNRLDFPNLQGIPIFNLPESSQNIQSDGLIVDCVLPNVIYNENILDKFLLNIFRNIVRKEINYRSETEGIKGLLEEGRHYMLSTEGTPENQHKFVKNALSALLTPILPPFYRIFMSGIIPCKENNDPKWLIELTDNIRNSLSIKNQQKFQSGKQFGPFFYAPFFTSVVTPIFLNFLVGPSQINYRKNGKLGGIIVEKCKFLQESNCKGLCLHQCKLPAQQFFQDKVAIEHHEV